MTSLATAIDQLNAAKRAHEEACDVVVAALLDAHPELRSILDNWYVPVDKAGPWLCGLHFDEGTKCAAELYLEGRGEEAAKRINQIGYGSYQ